QARCIVGERSVDLPLFGTLDAQLPIGLQPAGDRPTAPHGGPPEPATRVPTVDQDVGAGVGGWLEGADDLLGQVDLAVERHLLALADGLLPIELGSQGAAASEQDVQAGEQAMPRDA